MHDRRILVAAAGWHDESPGGANRLPTEFARYLARRGWGVTYLCASTLVDRTTSSDVDGVDLRRYPSPTAPSPSLSNVRAHWRMTSDIVHAIAGKGPIAAVLGHSPLQYLAAVRACAPGTRCCYAVHSPLVAELQEGLSGPPSWKQHAAWHAAWQLEARVLRASDVVHCYSAYTRRFMQTQHRTLNGRAIVLPGWVDIEHFQAGAASRDDLRTCLGPPWQAGVPTFFSLRRLVPRMGLDTLVDAAAVLAERGSVFRVVVGGEGPERSRLEERAATRGVADRVAFVGRIPDAGLSASYAAADCFVLPTRALECFGLIVLEAYACGVPVIGVPVGSIPEVMGEAFSGWIADDNHAPALARRMADFLDGRLIADPDALRSRAGRFDMHTVMDLHERVLLGAEPPT